MMLQSNTSFQLLTKIAAPSYSTKRTFLYFYLMERLPIYSINKFNTPNEDFYVSDLAIHLEMHHFIHAPHKHNFYLCVVFTKGMGVHEIDFVKYNIKAGSVFFIKPGKFHSWKFSTKMEGFIFFHSKEFYNLNYQNRQLQDFPFYFSEYNTPVLYTDNQHLKEINDLSHLLIRESANPSTFKAFKICSLIDLIYINLTRLYLPLKHLETKKSSYTVKLAQLEKYVERYFKEKKTPAEYAALMNMTTKHLNRIVKTALDKTVSTFIADRILLEAKRLLVHSDFRVAEVAEQLGFSDHSYFNRYFKKHAGQTPVEFASIYRSF